MIMETQENSPVLIIGTARSGTNMLRNVLTTLPGFTTWPCDEIPFIWKHGWRAFPHDEFTPDMATPGVKAYLAGRFAAVADSPHQVVVEKTCANSLRLGFVAAAVPAGRFVVIVRNPHDAIASAMLRWTSSFDLRYSLAKARYVPVTDIPYYGFRILRNRLVRLFSRKKQLGFWGPVFAGMAEARRNDSLAELAARQWVRCMQRTLEDWPLLPADRKILVRYEDFVTSPRDELNRILAFLGQQTTDQGLARATQTVKAGSVGKGLGQLSPADRAAIDRVLAASGLPEKFLRTEGPA